MSERIYDVQKIEFIVPDYFVLHKAEKTNFYLELLDKVICLREFLDKCKHIISGIYIELKNKDKNLTGNEKIKITKKTDVCFFYLEYKILIFLDLSLSLNVYDFNENIINLMKIEKYVKILLNQ
ncbi:MAG: hypothetical protein MJ252_19395, partial [archaeon]|nr:hypothetical protein [archaeon]